MKKHLFYLVLSVASCLSISLEAQNLFWHEMNTNEQQGYMLRKGEETLLERSQEIYGKDVTLGLNDITHEFSEVKEEATEENPAGRTLIRLTYHSPRHEKQSMNLTCSSLILKRKTDE